MLVAVCRRTAISIVKKQNMLERLGATYMRASAMLSSDIRGIYVHDEMAYN
jgi:hypothetical protein